jgi:hypothetical protein
MVVGVISALVVVVAAVIFRFSALVVAAVMVVDQDTEVWNE